MDAGTLKLLVAILLFSAPVMWCAEALPKRGRLNRAQAQAIGALVGLVVGVGFLLAVG